MSENYGQLAIGASSREHAIAVLPAMNDDEADANARLIAASPRLRDACQETLVYLIRRRSKVGDDPSLNRIISYLEVALFAAK